MTGVQTCALPILYTFNKNAKLLYNLGYVYTEPRDADYKKRNALENTYTCLLYTSTLLRLLHRHLVSQLFLQRSDTLVYESAGIDIAEIT